MRLSISKLFSKKNRVPFCDHWPNNNAPRTVKIKFWEVRFKRGLLWLLTLASVCLSPAPSPLRVLLTCWVINLENKKHFPHLTYPPDTYTHTLGQKRATWTRPTKCWSKPARWVQRASQTPAQVVLVSSRSPGGVWWRLQVRPGATWVLLCISGRNPRRRVPAVWPSRRCRSRPAPVSTHLISLHNLSPAI